MKDLMFLNTEYRIENTGPVFRILDSVFCLVSHL